MLVVGTVTVDLNWLFQLIATLIVIAVFLSHLFVKATAASSNFLTMIQQTEQEPEEEYSIRNKISPGSCVICGKDGINQCSACKLVKYCSTACQSSHWKSGHKTECKQFQLFGKCNSKKSTSIQNRWKDSKSVALVPGSIKQAKEILFPYEDFVEFYNCDKAGFPPCGLLNCGNSCFANVVLQCLSSTRPLVVYLLEKGHRKECRRNDWCFLCEFQTHIERASSSRQPFSPLNILSRLPNIGGNLGHGKQEDAHEFMRFAIDTMQSVCLDEFGGEKVLHPSTQETTLIQHIFGGHLQSQVVCSMCRNVSNQCENVMDLTVEIHGDASCLEECLDQFTAREQLHGDNMYKCDGCNDYVMAWKRLMIRRAPNILTIALKRFQSGRFGKLNKRVTFPETLDLRPYMSEEGDGNDVYKLYAVVVHVDMLNASFFGHYVCYTRDLYGNWYRIDDNKVSKVDLEDVLSEGAYMLLYSRVCPRPSCLKPVGSSSDNEEQKIKVVHQEESVEVVQGFPTVKTDLFSSTNISDEMDMAVSITTPSSSLEMDVSISQDSKTEKEYLFSSCAEVENQQRFDISDDVLELSSMENLQCVENSEIVESEQNHQDSNNLSTTADFKTDGDVDTDKGLKSASERNIAIKKSDNRKILKKPYLTPGFLGKRSGNKSRERCEKVPDDVDMTVSISTPSSSQDMDVPCIWDLKLVKENAFSKCSEVEDQQRTGICDDVLMKDSEIVVSEQNHRDSNNLQNTANSKSDRDKMEIENGLKSPSEEGIAIKMLDKRKNLKPFLTPGFLVKHEKYHCDSISEPNLMEML